MSKRSRRHQHPTRAQIVTERRDIAREQEILSTPIGALAGNRAIEAMLRRLGESNCTNEEAARIGLAVQAIIRGDAALLNNMGDPGVAETVSHIIEQQAAYDRAEQEYEQDRLKFAEEVIDRAEKIAPVREKQPQIIANAMQMQQEARHQAGARQAYRRMELQRHLDTDEKELITISSITEIQMINDAPTAVEVPVVLHIMGRRFLLRPGTRMIPKILADHYRRYMRGREERRERKNVLAQNLEAKELKRRQDEIDRKYGVNVAPIPAMNAIEEF